MTLMTSDRPSDLMADLRNGVSDSPSGNPSGFVPAPPYKGGFNSDDSFKPEACRIVAVNLSSYLDAELDQDQDEMIENHLDHCNDCTSLLEAMIATDSQIQREWRDSTPLLLSPLAKRSIDSIMDALPPAPEKQPIFSSKRVHARARWTRFAAGLTGVFTLVGLPCATYFMGYQSGKQSADQLKPYPSVFRRLTPKLSFNQSRFPQSVSLLSPQLKGVSP